MAFSDESIETALQMLKYRINRAGHELDDYLVNRLRADVGALSENGIKLTDSIQDIMLLVDYTAWRYANRDKPGAMPEWLRLLRRERWLAEKMKEAGHVAG